MIVSNREKIFLSVILMSDAVVDPLLSVDFAPKLMVEHIRDEVVPIHDLVPSYKSMEEPFNPFGSHVLEVPTPPLVSQLLKGTWVLQVL